MITIGGKELAKVLHYYGLLEGESEFKIVCPFHEDINASMKINLNEGNFYCFGCSLSGDALRFTILMNKRLNELESCMKFFKILKSDKTRAVTFKRYKVSKKATEEAKLQASDYYFGLRQTNWLRIEAEDRDIRTYMKQRGFEAKTLNKCRAKVNYSTSYPIIFPMFDMKEFKGWVCRTMNPKIQQKRKYLYNSGFSRRDTLVGKYDAQVVALVEGYMDWLKMKQFGVKNVAAILGWKATEQQIQKLKKQGVRTIISALDNDECGRKGTSYLRNFFNVIPFAFPSDVKDPGDLNQLQFSKAKEKTKIILGGTKKWV